MHAQTDITSIKVAFQAELEAVVTEQDLQRVRDRYLGRKQGAVAMLMKSMAAATASKIQNVGSRRWPLLSGSSAAGTSGAGPAKR